MKGVYLADLLATQECTMPSEIPLDGTFVHLPLGKRQGHAADASGLFGGWGVEGAVHKAFRAQAFFKAWGAEVDGI